MLSRKSGTYKQNGTPTAMFAVGVPSSDAIKISRLRLALRLVRLYVLVPHGVHVAAVELGRLLVGIEGAAGLFRIGDPGQIFRLLGHVGRQEDQQLDLALVDLRAFEQVAHEGDV